MKRLINAATSVACAVTLMVGCSVHAQELENSLLWKVEKKRSKTSYLFGTIHVMPQADFEMKPKVSAALGQSEILVLEMDITEPGMQLQMMQYAMMKDGHTIDEYLADSTYKKVDLAIQTSTGMSLGMMNTMKPFIVSSFLITQFTGPKTVSFEVILAEMANKDSIPILGLETLEEQMSIFDAIPYQEQADGLAEMVENPTDMQALYTDMVEAYKAEDLNLLGAMLAEEMTSEAESQELLVKRNHKWIPLIESQIKHRHSFIAVGAAHLGGNEGVIELLRKEGYTVTAVLK